MLSAPAPAAASESNSETTVIAAEREPRPLGLWSICGLALVMGVVTGCGAALFRALIGFVHNLLFLGHASFAYDASLFTPQSPWGMFVILVPVLGSLGVTFIVNTFAPEAKGHGVPEVMDLLPAWPDTPRGPAKSVASAERQWGARGRSSRSARHWARLSASWWRCWPHSASFW
jgi:H+/Cl- antiporter ClcA